MNRRTIIVVAVSVLLAACGGTTAETTTSQAATTSTSTIAATTTSTATTTTSTSTTTTTSTTLPPTTTTTTTLPPLPVAGWDDEGPRTVAVEFDLDGPDTNLEIMVIRALRSMGLEVDQSAETVLSLDLRGEAKGADYKDAGYCYTGARVRGDITLTGPDRPRLHETADGTVQPSFVVFGNTCAKKRDPEDAPFQQAFEPDFMETMVSWWGQGTIPYLADILRDDLYITPIRTDAVQSVRLMTWGDISPDYQYLFLDAVLWYAGRTTYQAEDVGDIAIYREAVERLFFEALDMEVTVRDDPGVWDAQRQLDQAYGK